MWAAPKSILTTLIRISQKKRKCLNRLIILVSPKNKKRLRNSLLLPDTSISTMIRAKKFPQKKSRFWTLSTRVKGSKASMTSWWKVITRAAIPNSSKTKALTWYLPSKMIFLWGLKNVSTHMTWTKLLRKFLQLLIKELAIRKKHTSS